MSNYGTAAKETAWEALARLDRVAGISRLAGNHANAILTYHSVGEPGRYGNVSTGRFRRTLSYLADRYEVVDLTEAVESVDDPGKRVAVTFDDGWANFYDHALPVLRDLDLPATVFVVTRYVDSDPMMSTEQVAELADDPLVTVGSHTRTHPHLPRVGDPETLHDEITGAKEDLAERFGITATAFSYPRGDVTPEALALVREAHDLAVTTEPRVLDPRVLGGDLDPHRLPRIKGHTSESRLRWELTDASSKMRAAAKRRGLVTW